MQIRGYCYLIDIPALLLAHFNLVLENNDIPKSFRVGLNAAPQASDHLCPFLSHSLYQCNWSADALFR
jgi:hypothetical protein